MFPTIDEQVRNMLPWWVGAASMLTTTVLFSLLTLIVCIVGAWVAEWPLRRAIDKPWYEHARHVHALRLLLAVQAIVWPVVTGVLVFMWPLPLAYGLLPRLFVPGLASFLVALVVLFWFESRVLEGRYSIGQLIKNTLLYSIAFGRYSIVLVVLAALLMPRDINMWAVVIVVTTVGIFVVISRWMPDVLRCLGLLTPADERLAEIVRTAAAQVGAPQPKCLRAAVPSANALAFPWNNTVVFTDGSLECLNDEQLAAVATHEICHLGMPRLQKVMRIVNPLLVLVPLILVRPVWMQFGSRGLLVGLAGLVVVLLLVRVLAQRMMQREEERADRAGADLHEETYATALERIYQHNLVPSNWKSPLGHPPLYDRMTAAGAPPDYPRPRPPSPWIRHVAMAAQMAVFFILALVLMIVGLAVSALVPYDANSQLAMLALLGGGANQVADLGAYYYEEGKDDLAAAMLKSAGDMSSQTGNTEVLSRIAVIQARHGDCGTAKQTLRNAREQAEGRILDYIDQQRLAEAEQAVEDICGALDAP